MEIFIEYSAQWKDFFWIVFTLAATMTSILTYLHVRKGIYQSLYNKVIESQIDVYSSLLELLNNSAADFLYSCDFDLLIKYNLLAHCVHFGFFEDEELLQKIYCCYMKVLQYESDDDSLMTNEELEDVLKRISSITLHVTEDINHGELEYEQDDKSVNTDNSKLLKLGVGVFHLTNIRGAFFQTPSFSKLYDELMKCRNNIYLPKRLSRRIEDFHQALLDMILGKSQGIVNREEEKIFEAECGEKVEINFDPFMNEILEDSGKLMKKYDLVKREIRRLLKIER